MGTPHRPVKAVIACAMAQELEPFLERVEDLAELDNPALPFAGGSIYTGTLLGAPVALTQTGIGLVNAAAAAVQSLNLFTPDVYVAAGTTGGLHPSVEVRDVIVSTDTCYLDADATAFGYELGQIPQMPARYSAVTPSHGFGPARKGQVLSGNSFVTATEANRVRRLFPDALAVDMETAALAQVCYLREVPWISIRAVSDLCGPAAGQEFHVESETAAELSFEAVRDYLQSAR